MRRAPWESFDAAPEGDPVVAAELVPELPRSPAKRREAAYETRKAELSRAWISPQRAPWGQATRTPMQPQYWNDPPVDPVTAVVEPAAINPRKGAGPVTPEEVEKVRAEERSAFARRLAERWRWNVSHL
jgi:hypothetical protein